MSPRTTAANQQIKDARREAILNAALKVFARNGLAGTRSGDIAAAAGVSQGLLYHYFPSKEALFTEIVEAALRGTAALMASALASPGSAWERLHRLCEQMLAGVVEDPEYPLVILQTFTSEAVPEEARAAYEQFAQPSFQHLVALIQEGQREGEVVDGNPAELALVFTACIQGIALSRLEGNGPSVPAPRPEAVLRLLRA